MDEVQEFCRRVLGEGPAADEAAAAARSPESDDRVALLGAAARACRARAQRGGDREVPKMAPADEHRDLAAAVARELAIATAALPERQREVLALRELLCLSYEQISAVMDIERAAVAPLLARSRLQLRVERRGTAIAAGTECGESERALRLLAFRQDSEPLSPEDGEWLLEHMSACAACEISHAAMLESSVCYRAWRPERSRRRAAPEHER